MAKRLSHRRGALTALVSIGVLASALLGASSAWARSALPSLVWSPTTSSGTYNYGTLNAGQAKEVTFTLENTGGKASGALTVTLPGSSAFSVTSDECTERSLGPNKSCTVTVKYAPASSDESDTATLTGTSKKTSASITLEGKSAAAGPPDLVLEPPAVLTGMIGGTKEYTFGFSAPEGGSETTMFTVKNEGTGASGSPLTVIGESPSSTFGFSSSCFAALAPGGSCTFTVVFTAPAGCSGEAFPAVVQVLVIPTPVYISLSTGGKCTSST